MDIMYQINRPGFQFHYAETLDPARLPLKKHCHFMYEAYLFLEGNLDYTVGSETFSLTPYDMLLIPPSVFHFGQAKGGRVYRRTVLSFSENLLPVCLRTSLKHTPALLHLSPEHKIAALFNNLRDYARDCTEEELDIVGGYYVSELALLLKHYTRAIEREDCREAVPPPLISRTVAFINDHITEEINLDRLALELYVTKFHLSHVFKQNYGIGVIEFIRRKKLDHVRLLIRAGVKPQKACTMTGFKNYTTFYRMYKSHFHTAPSKLRPDPG